MQVRNIATPNSKITHALAAELVGMTTFVVGAQARLNKAS